MSELDWDPVEKDACRPESRAVKVLKAIQAAVDAHDAASGTTPAEVRESRVQFDSPEKAVVHRSCRNPDGAETVEAVTVVLDGDQWRVISVEPGG